MVNDAISTSFGARQGPKHQTFLFNISLLRLGWVVLHGSLNLVEDKRWIAFTKVW